MARRNLFDADPEIRAEVDRVQSPLSITVEGFAQDEFPVAAGDIIAWTIVGFVIGGIAAGFLSEAGGQLFRQLSVLSTRLLERRRKRTVFQAFDSHRIVAVVMLEIGGVQVVVSSKALGTTFVDGHNVGTTEVARFFEHLERCLPEIVQEAESAERGTAKAVYIEYWDFGDVDRGWRIRRHLERLSLEEVAQWHGCRDDHSVR